MLCFFVCHSCLFAVVCRFTKPSMVLRLETSLVWFCLSFVCVLAEPLNVTPRTFRRRYSPDSAVTSAAVNSTSVARTSAVSGNRPIASPHPRCPASGATPQLLTALCLVRSTSKRNAYSGTKYAQTTRPRRWRPFSTRMGMAGKKMGLCGNSWIIIVL